MNIKLVVFFITAFAAKCVLVAAATEREFHLAQLRAECMRFNAAAAARALDDLSKNHAYDAARHAVPVGRAGR